MDEPNYGLLEYKDLAEMEVKEVAEAGTFTGIASVYGVEDLGQDVIEKGAMRKSIEQNPNVRVLWQHRPDEVIGEGTVKEWQGKVMLDAQLDMEDPLAQKAFRKLKKGLIKGLSIGFTTVKSSFKDIEGRMVRHIEELKLWEVSVVTFPMLPEAQVTRVKQYTMSDLTALREEFQALRAEVAELQQLKSLLTEKHGAANTGTEVPPELVVLNTLMTQVRSVL